MWCSNHVILPNSSLSPGGAGGDSKGLSQLAIDYWTLSFVCASLEKLLRGLYMLHKFVEFQWTLESMGSGIRVPTCWWWVESVLGVGLVLLSTWDFLVSLLLVYVQYLEGEKKKKRRAFENSEVLLFSWETLWFSFCFGLERFLNLW